MLERQNTISRANTYLPKEFFKLIILAPTRELSESYAQWITNSKTSNRGVYGCPYNKSQMIVFFRWPGIGDRQATTVAVEAMLMFSETKEEFELIQSEQNKYGNIPVKVLISNNNELESVAKSNAISFFKKEEDPATLRTRLDQLDKDQLKSIKKIFTSFDTDNSGFIDSKEMREIAISLKENPDTIEFRQAMLALDFNGDGQISFTEFISWWKIGRQNTLTLPKIYKLNLNTQDFIKNTLDFPSYVKEISQVGKVKDNKSSQKIFLRSPGVFRFRTFADFSFAVGGQMRTQMACDFLSQFTKNTSISKNNWISLLITLDEKSPIAKALTPSKSKALLEEFKDNLLSWGEANANPVLVSFVKNLMIFEFNSNEKNVILVSRLKLDIEELVKGAIQQIIFIIKNFSDKDDSSWFTGKVHSNIDLNTDEKVNLGEFLKNSEILFEGSMHKNRTTALFSNLLKGLSKWKEFFKFLYVPNNFDLEFEGDYSQFNDHDIKDILNFSMENISFLFKFLKNNISSTLLSASKNIEFGVNVFDVFARGKFYSKSLFSETYDIKKDI